MRGLLIVNPRATSTTGNGTDLVVSALGELVDLDIAHTRYRGHARELAASAAGHDVVIVLGGDGAINEVVNGLMERTGGSRAADPPGAPALSGPPALPAGPSLPPLLAVIPGGGGNVFGRALGLPLAPAAAAARVAALLATGEYRTIGLGLAGDRYFTFSAGIGMDAEVVHDVDGLRARGRRESNSLFVRAIVRRYYSGTDRHVPALTLERDGMAPDSGLFMGIVTNSSPWTYFRGRPLLPVPNPDFNSGLDVLALSRLRMPTILSAIGQMICAPDLNRTPRGKHVITASGLGSFTVRSARPIAFHVDGEYLGETESVKFHFTPDALRVAAPAQPPALPPRD